MADVFVSYRNTTGRGPIVRRLALFLQVHGISSWWDYGLEAGEQFEDRIKREIADASVVMPLWCFESVFLSPWVIKEATWGKEKLYPIRLQDVPPPPQFATYHASDLTGWDGDTRLEAMDQLIVSIFRTLQRPLNIPRDLREELALLPKLTPLPTHSHEFYALLEEFIESYRFNDALAYRDVRHVSLQTPLSEFATKEGVLDGILDILFAREMVEDLKEGAIDILDANEMATVGDLIGFLISHRKDGAAALRL